MESKKQRQHLKRKLGGCSLFLNSHSPEKTRDTHGMEDMRREIVDLKGLPTLDFAR